MKRVYEIGAAPKTMEKCGGSFPPCSGGKRADDDDDAVIVFTFQDCNIKPNVYNIKMFSF